MDDLPILYDVGVVGGGLAGLTLSIQCADAGLSTILFEKEIYPFHKVCGEYISMESYGFLERLGLPLSKEDVPVIKKLQLTDTRGNLYEFDLPLGGFGISRYRLDNALYEIAKSKGVKVLTGLKVLDINFGNDSFIISSNTGNYTSTMAAGTFGKRSNLDVKWKRDFITRKQDKLSNYIAVKYHVRYPFPKDQIALHNFHNGYCGISNIENDTCCFCYLTTGENLRKNNNSITEMERNVLWKNPLLKDIFSTATFVYKEPLVISQVNFGKKQQVENHALMIGDAAGLITPLCGNGMSMAMHGSKLAFENIQAFFQKRVNRSQVEDNYERQWKQQFSRRLFVGRTVQRLFGNNTSTSTFLKIMQTMPWLAKKIIRSTHGRSF